MRDLECEVAREDVDISSVEYRREELLKPYLRALEEGISVPQEKESDEVETAGEVVEVKVGPLGLKMVKNGKSSVRKVQILVLHVESGLLVLEKK